MSDNINIVSISKCVYVYQIELSLLKTLIIVSLFICLLNESQNDLPNRGYLIKKHF